MIRQKKRSATIGLVILVMGILALVLATLPSVPFREPESLLRILIGFFGLLFALTGSRLLYGSLKVPHIHLKGDQVHVNWNIGRRTVATDVLRLSDVVGLLEGPDGNIFLLYMKGKKMVSAELPEEPSARKRVIDELASKGVQKEKSSWPI